MGKNTPSTTQEAARQLGMYAICIFFPLLGIYYGTRLGQASGDDVQRLGRQLVLAGVAGLAWWIGSCGLLWLALMTVLKTINLIP